MGFERIEWKGDNQFIAIEAWGDKWRVGLYDAETYTGSEPSIELVHVYGDFDRLIDAGKLVDQLCPYPDFDD